MSLEIQGQDGKLYTFDDEQAILVRRLHDKNSELVSLLKFDKRAIVRCLVATLEREALESEAKDQRIAILEEELRKLREANHTDMQVVDTAINYLES